MNMKPIGFIQYGNFFEYKEKIKKIGKPMCFKKGTDVIPFLKGNHYAFYIDKGTLYLRLYKAEGCYMQNNVI